MTSKATKISCLKIKVIHLFRYFFLKFSLGDGSTTLTKYTFQIRKLDRYKFNANSYANSIEQLRLFIIECFKRSFDYSDDYLSVKDQMKIVNQNLSYLQSIHQKIYIANQSMLKLGKEFSKYFLRFRIKFTRFFLVKSFKTKKEKCPINDVSNIRKIAIFILASYCIICLQVSCFFFSFFLFYFSSNEF